MLSLFFVVLTEFFEKLFSKRFFLFLRQIFDLDRLFLCRFADVPNQKNDIARKKDEEREDKGREVDVCRMLSEVTQETIHRSDVSGIFTDNIDQHDDVEHG